MLLKAVGILAVASVIRADGWLNISHLPGFRTQHAQEGTRVHRTGTNLAVIRLPDQAALFSPKFLQ